LFIFHLGSTSIGRDWVNLNVGGKHFATTR